MKLKKVFITVAVAAAVASGSQGVCHAFSTYVHPEISARAVEGMGFGAEALQLLQAAAVRPDRDWNYTIAKNVYRPEVHSDLYKADSRSATPLGSFKFGVEYIQGEQDAAIAAANAGLYGKAMAHIGQGMHTAQDLLSHTNYAEMSEKDQALVRAYVFNRAKVKLPANLTTTEWDPAAEIPGIPPGAPYPHDLKAKDWMWQNDMSSMQDKDHVYLFQKAYDHAVQFSILYLGGIVPKLNKGVWNDLRNVHIWDVWPEIPETGKDGATCRNNSVWWVTHGGSGTICGEE